MTLNRPPEIYYINEIGEKIPSDSAGKKWRFQLRPEAFCVYMYCAGRSTDAQPPY